MPISDFATFVGLKPFKVDPDAGNILDILTYLSLDVDNYTYLVGTNDIELGQRLIRSGAEHRRFLRQIEVCVDITAPLYWWKEFDPYKVGTVANSTSTMHKLASTPITTGCFETDDYEGGLVVDKRTSNAPDFPGMTYDVYIEDFVNATIKSLENLRQKYLETKDKRYSRHKYVIIPL